MNIEWFSEGDLVSHTSGVVTWEKPVKIEDLYDTATATAKLAAQSPWWEPGTASGYHSHTHGFLIGELIRRTTGKSLKQFVAEDLAAPLGADVQIGALEKDYGRIATVVPPPKSAVEGPAPPAGSVMEKAHGAPAIDASVSETDGWRRAEHGGGGGFGNGRGVARVLSAISLGGTVAGVKLLSPETIDKIFVEQSVWRGPGSRGEAALWDLVRVTCEGHVLGLGSD